MPHIAVNGSELWFSDEGEGLPVLLSHSLFFDHTMFDALTPLLVAAGCRVVRWDHRNQGRSRPAPAEECDMDTLTLDAAALVEALGLGPVHVAGNSMGGFVALRLAARRPDLVASAVAMSSSAEEEHSAPEFLQLLEVLRTDGPAPLLDVLVHIMFGDDAPAAQPELVAAARAAFAQLPPGIAGSALGVIRRAPVVDELSGCTVPVLAIGGAQDHTYPPPVSTENIAAAAGGRAVTVDGAGHSVALEQPAATAAALLEHLSAWRTPRR